MNQLKNTESSVIAETLIEHMTARNAAICILTLLSGMTLKEVGVLFDISSCRVRQIRLKGERRLRDREVVAARQRAARRYLA